MKDSNSSTSHSAYVSLISSPSDTIATTPSVLSATHPSPAERTLSTLSTTSISNTATLPHPNTNINANTNINTSTNTNDTIHSNNKSLPYSTANAYHVSTSTSPFWIGSAYSRGISIESIYSSMINNKNQTGHHSILKRKLSISDQEDHDIWLRFRTTNFRAQS
ncbi:hypothetical protein BJ944DRAFT_259343 [Cunninghamella echinulata]|nr:hypothetical protein BJ944DRAFT_259343 [Cunninghamella echinulata]